MEKIFDFGVFVYYKIDSYDSLDFYMSSLSEWLELHGSTNYVNFELAMKGTKDSSAFIDRIGDMDVCFVDKNLVCSRKEALTKFSDKVYELASHEPSIYSNTLGDTTLLVTLTGFAVFDKDSRLPLGSISFDKDTGEELVNVFDNEILTRLENIYDIMDNPVIMDGIIKELTKDYFSSKKENTN